MSTPSETRETGPDPCAVIMAGGEGTRLRPFTYTIPKPLLPLGRKPVAQIIIERLRGCGFRRVIMSVEYGADLIRAYFQDGAQFGVRISYFHEPFKMGTAGCLAHIAELRGAPFLVTNGDILADLDYREFLDAHVKSNAAMSVATRAERISIPYGVIREQDGLIQSIEEKPSMEYCFNAGIYSLSPEALAPIPADRAYDMTELISALAGAGKPVRTHPIGGAWFDLAKVDDFEKALAEIGQV